MSKDTVVRWDTPAGKTLRSLLKVLPDRPFTITLFGSSPLQLIIEPDFVSADVDLFPSEWDDGDILAKANTQS